MNVAERPAGEHAASCDLLLALLAAQVTLLSDGKLDTTATGHRDPALLAVANDENVAETRRELTAGRVADVHNVKATVVTLHVDQLASTANVAATRHYDLRAGVELDKVDHLLVHQVILDGVIDAHERVGVTESAAVVGHDLRHALGTQLDALHLQQLVLSLLSGDAVHNEAALHIVEDAEVLARLVNRHDVLEAGRVGRVRTDLVVDLDDALHRDGLHLTASEGVLQAVAQQNLSS